MSVSKNSPCVSAEGRCRSVIKVLSDRACATAAFIVFNVNTTANCRCRYHQRTHSSVAAFRSYVCIQLLATRLNWSVFSLHSPWPHFWLTRSLSLCSLWHLFNNTAICNNLNKNVCTCPNYGRSQVWGHRGPDLSNYYICIQIFRKKRHYIIGLSQ